MVNRFRKRFPYYPDDTDYTTNSPSYYDDLARKNKLIKLLSEKIWEYEKTLDLTLEEISNRLESYIEENDNLMTERLEQWDENLKKFPENVELLLQEWLEDGTLDHIINDTIFNWKADKTYVDDLYENVTTQLTQTTHNVQTTNDMLLGSYNTGKKIKTDGYHTPNDGGGNIYQVIPLDNATKSYDLVNDNVGFRPIIKGIINPKQFGTFNNGVDYDNFGLQACYDYADDYSIFQIDGQSLTYTIGTVNKYDDRDYGAVIESGHKLSNFNFKLADGFLDFTNALSIRMTKKDIYLENINIDGNRLNSGSTTIIGDGDGGCHGINIYAKDNTDSKTILMKTGNIYIHNVNIKDIYSYGILVGQMLDCTMRLTDVNFDLHGLAVLPATTNFEVFGSKITIGEPRPNLVSNAFQFETAMTQIKTNLVVHLEDIHFNAKSRAPIYQNLYAFQNDNSPNMTFDRITIKNTTVENGRAINIYSRKLDLERDFYHGSINLINIDFINSRYSFNLGCEKEYQLNFESILIDGCKDVQFMQFVRVGVGDYEIKNTNIIASRYKDPSLTGRADTLKLTNVNVVEIAQSLEVPNDIKKLIINHCEFSFGSDTRDIFSFSNVDKINVSDVLIKVNETIRQGIVGNFLRLGDNTEGEIEVIMNNVFVNSSEYITISHNLFRTNKSDGFVYLNNVRHKGVETSSNVYTPNLPLNNVILTDCEQLIV